MSARTTRSVLAHELGHAQFGHTPARVPVIRAQQERQADEWAACRLITPRAYAEAEELRGPAPGQSGLRARGHHRAGHRLPAAPASGRRPGRWLNTVMAFLVAPAPVTLTGELVELRPLERSHVDGLIDAVQEGDLWKTAWYTSVPAPDGVGAEVDRRLSLIERGEMVPFTAFGADGRVLGLTSYYDIVADVPRLHIGYTWNRPSAHGTGTNAESKLLLLRHAFETLGVFRVGLTTQWGQLPVPHGDRAARSQAGRRDAGHEPLPQRRAARQCGVLDHRTGVARGKGQPRGAAR